MSAYAAHKLQESIYTALSGSTPLNTLVTAIYDEPITGAVMPYVSLGETSTLTNDTKTEYGITVTFDIQIMSDEASQMQSKEIAAVIDELLHDSSIQVTGYDLIFLFNEKTKIERKTEDTSTYHTGTLTYKARLYKIN